jgi:hypothetical protein
VFLGHADDLGRAVEYADRVQKIVGKQPNPDDYWTTATVGEVFLIQRNYQESGRIYEAAVAVARAEVGSHLTTWKQACRLMAKLQPTEVDRALIRKAFTHLPDCGQF